ncbi:hypothetical protein C7K70_11355 [Aeromonas hydrophila]|nr:hypothetical protein C7K70_11355 [Aeromonas hydrophila]
MEGARGIEAMAKVGRADALRWDGDVNSK